MASIRKRGASYQVQIRRDGYPSLSQSFPIRADAVAWARDQERKIDWGEAPVPRRAMRKVTVGDLLDRYEGEITSTKRGQKQERSKLSVIRARPIVKVSLDKLTGSVLAQYRDGRLLEVSSGTVRRELAILQHCFEVARREWDMPVPVNPVQQIKLPAPSKARDRRLMPEEIDAFWQSVERARATWLKPFIILAIETGMRRGELLSIRWKDVDFRRGLVTLSMTKNGHARSVPLTPLAVLILGGIKAGHDRLFPLKPTTVRQAWERLIARADIKDLRLHDLRHEAISRFFELGLTVPEVALISGHRDSRMLARYTHLRPESVAEKLAMLTKR